MGKAQFSIFYFITIILLVYVIVLCCRSRGKLKIKCLVINILAALTNAFYLLYLFSSSKILMSISQSLVYIGFTWLMFFFMGYIYSYTEHVRKKIPSTILFFMAILNSIIMFLNIFTECAISYEVVQIGNDMYLTTTYKPIYIYHLVLNYSVVILFVAALVVKAVQVPSVYKSKYITILGFIFGITIVNAVYLYTSLMIDISLLAYGFFAIFIYHYTLNYSPKSLVKKTRELVINGMTDAVIIFDTYENYFYANQSAFNLLGEEIKNYSMLEFKDKKLKHYDYSQLFAMYYGGKKLYLEIETAPFKDSKNRIQAYYFILHDITDRVEKIEMIEYQNTHDELTNIYNRRYFEEEAKKIIAKSNEPFYVVTSNYKGFRLVNDMFGSKAGDKILVATAEYLKRICDKMNLLYARMDSDKFAILISKADFEKKSFTDILTTSFDKITADIPTELKFGVCEIIENNILQAYERSVITIHYINRIYNQNIGYFSTDIQEKSIREQELLLDLDSSLANHNFEIYLQPQVNSNDESVVGAEALIRWNHPKYGRISPGEFIPLFEKHFVISKLDLFVWEEACRLLQKWNDGDNKKLSISVNISAIDFYQINVSEVFVNLINKYDIEPSRLKLEITETVFMSDQKKIIAKIKELQEAGFTIEMDDFGSGYSSFNTLKDIPIDVLKLDMKFIEGDINNEKTIEILDSIVSMAHRIHLPVIAEGVETKEQSQLLRMMNCELNQGYLYAKPMPINEFEDYIKNKSIKSFIDYWTHSYSDKEIFSSVKELHRCYGSSPIPMVILSPKYNDEKQLEDVVVFYCNSAFARIEEIDIQKIIGQSIKQIYNSLNDDMHPLIEKLLNGENDVKQIIDRKNGSQIHIHAYSIKKKYICAVLTYL